ncbi:uncharacterized protein METZ01_LOCUS131698 [marine metagenome]|uniref:Uncharacterized protein n=1 Tax=marine metagenome TaxID=408172 RepID=A0A381YPH2_9ZZZZ
MLTDRPSTVWHEQASLFLRVSSITIRKPDLAAAIRAAAPNTFIAFSTFVVDASEEEAVRLAYDAIAVDRMGLLSAGYVDIDALRETWLTLTNRG